MKKILIILSLAISLQLPAKICFAQAKDYIRVLIIKDTKSLSLRLLGDYEIVDLRGNNVLSKGPDLRTTVMGYKSGILIAGRSFNTGGILIKTKENDSILINGRTFRGHIKLIKEGAYLTAINQIGLEDYIKGILYHEASHYWPIEALKAQAIVCRTYAVYQIEQNKSKDYDVTSDIYSQVYGGKASERYRTNEAVEATNKEVLVYKNKVFPAFFHATCAGHTEDASLLWNIDIAPLKGVVCDFCKGSPHYGWHLVLDRGELRQRLANAGHKMGVIKNIEILGKGPSGRITDLKIITATRDVIIPAKDFRGIVGPNEIRSTKFMVAFAGEDAVFEGIGWGHGAGLCQWGAYFMAKEGKMAGEILKYYYPQSNVKTIGF